MRVLVVAPDYHGYDMATAQALRSLGCSVALLSYFPHATLRQKATSRIVDEVLPRAHVTAPAEARRRRFRDVVLATARHGAADAVLVIKGEILDPDTVEELGRRARLVHWAFDDPYRYARVRESLPLYSSIAAFSRADTKRLLADGYPAFHLPDGYDSTSFGVTMAVGPPSWHKQVSFLGARYPRREELLAPVSDAFELGIWGGDWKRDPWRSRYYQPRSPLDRACMGKAGPREADLVYRSCLVNLNIHGPWDGLNMRVFEIPGAGGFQLCDERDELAEYLEPGRDVATYAHPEELLDMLARYVACPDERARIAQAGQARVRSEHTLLHRARRLMVALEGNQDG